MERSAKDRAIDAVKGVFPKSVKTAVWLIKITVFISAAILLLRYFNILPWFSKIISPVFNYVGLPGEASLAFVTGYFVNVYSAIAVMVTLDLDVRAMTILAIMILCAHNMITETAVQNKTGSSILRIVLTRTLSAFILGFVLNLIIPGDVSSAVILKDQDKISFLAMLTEWIVSTGRLVIKMVVLIMGLSFLQVLLSEFGVIRWLSNFLRPLMKFFGLPAKTSFLWIVANTLGLAYGAAIMMEETESGKITKEDANLLNHHIGISHSNLEDVLLMGSMGAMMLWMLFSRWFMSLILVWELRLEMAIRKKFVTLRPN
jgi:hypothetical protein